MQPPSHSPRVVKMEGRSTVLTAPRPISASGKPSSESTTALLQPRPSSSGSHFPQQFVSEYERSFRPFDKYHFSNGTWHIRKPIKDAPREWIGELRDIRQRALQNKARARGDHFSSSHLLQIPSKANEFWEPPVNVRMMAADEPENVCFSSQQPETHVVTSAVNSDYALPNHRPAPGLTRQNLVMSEVAGANGLAERHLSSTAVQTGEQPKVGPFWQPATSVSRATQTSPHPKSNNHENNTESRLLYEFRNGRGDYATDTEVDYQGKQKHESTRLEILRKAKYFDAKDAAPPTSSVPRSASMRSLLSDYNTHGSTYHSVPPARDRRPRSSMTIAEAGAIGSAASRHVRALSATQPLPVTRTMHNASELRASDRNSAGYVATLSSTQKPPPPPNKANRFLGGSFEDKENRLATKEAQTSGGSGGGERAGGHFPPGSAFTISPPKRNVLAAGVTNGSTKASEAWDLPPPERKPLSQTLRASDFVKNVTKIVQTPTGGGRNVQSKDRYSAWIDL
ncbi:hypothetical protein BV898_01815 [Hypsibius exemplaris]|uniref:Nuclear protein MDM1 n=1 Tax=Hypsibius exemplaris TaxID=2072580 RepID=A0A1W0XA51_HYPEX|nr:hypothetical protein BV898_01815 [Hypsibius exemplaris]